MRWRRRYWRPALLGLLFLAAFSLGCWVPSRPAGDFRPVVVYGDTRSGHEAHRKVLAAVLKVHPAAVFHTGDLVEDGLVPAEWDTFNAIVSPLLEQSPLFPAIGNHERNSELYFDNFELPNNEEWYSVEQEGIHFIVLNSCSGIGKDSEQFQWLERDLAEAGGKEDFIVVVLHHPPYSTGPHDEDEKGLRETVVPMFEKWGVSVVFSGHDHTYERSVVNGIYYVVTGGGGAPLYDQARESPWSQVFAKKHHFCVLSRDSRRLLVEAFDPDFRVIDRFGVARRLRASGVRIRRPEPRSFERKR